MIVAMLAALLVLCAPAKRPEIAHDRLAGDIVDKATGKVHAGDLGWASLKEVKVLGPETKSDQAVLLADVTAEQSALGERSTLTARLRLRYEWRKRQWALSGVEEVRKWSVKEPKPAEPGRPELGENQSDSAAIRGLIRAKQAARRNLGGVPMIPPP
jgi:hypothetical protein